MKTMIALLLFVLAAPVLATDAPVVREYTLELMTSVSLPMMAMPAYPGMPDAGGAQPSRTISGEAVYATAAPVTPVFVAVPESLQLRDNRLPLQVTQMPEGMLMPPAGMGAAPGGRMHVEMKNILWWHPDTAAGPLTESINTDVDMSARGGARPAMPSETQLQRVRAELDRTATGEENVVPLTAVGRGEYVLNTGGHTMPLAGFLLPLTVTEPASPAAIDVRGPITVVWNSDTAARGYILHARGMVLQGQQVKETVLWVSTDSCPPERVRTGYEAGTTIADDVRDRILLPPGTTRCVIPPAIFAQVDMLTLTLTAVGADYAADTRGCRYRARIRSEWTATKMPGMGGPGAGRYGAPTGMPAGYPPAGRSAGYPPSGAPAGNPPSLPEGLTPEMMQQYGITPEMLQYGTDGGAGDE